MRLIVGHVGRDGDDLSAGLTTICAPVSRRGDNLSCARPGLAAFVRKAMLESTRAAGVTIYLPGPLRACCAGASELFLSAPSVRAALEQIERSHPALHRNICDETGAVRRHINLFVNSDHVRERDGLDTPLVTGDVLTILPAVSGG